MNWFHRFMYGRLGLDQLNITMLLISFVVSFSGRVFELEALTTISFVFLVLGFYRFFSKNLVRRRAENEKYLKLTRPITVFVNGLLARWKFRKTHMFIKCKTCGTLLRLPKGKGRIRVSCPECKNTFEKNT